MARARIGIGEHGNIATKQLGKRQFTAQCRYRDIDGIVRQQSAQGSSKENAINELKAKLKTRFVAMDGDIKPTTTLRELGDLWLEDIKSNGSLRDQSRATYAANVKLVTSEFGDVQVREVTVPRLKTMLNVLKNGRPKKNGRPALIGSEAKKNRARVVLSLMLTLAVESGAIPTNPVASLGKRSRSEKNVRALDVEGACTIRELVVAWENRPRSGPKSDNLSDVFDMMLATGTRFGEVLAIRWGDVNLEAKTVSINGTLVYMDRTDGKLNKKGNKVAKELVRQPVTKGSKPRLLTLPDWAIDILARRAEGSMMNDQDPVFPSRTGGFISPHNMRTTWRKARAGTEFEWVTPHVFRKTVATAIGHPETAKLVLGHKDVRTTGDHYLADVELAPDVTKTLDRFAPAPKANEED